MRKANTKDNKQNKKNNLLIGGALLAVLVVLTVFVLSRPSSLPTGKISPADYQQQFASTGASHLLIDVRTPEEFATGHLAGAVNISLQTLPDRLNEIPHDKPVVLYCRSGNRSNEAFGILNKAGYTNIYDLGGIISWTASGLPVVQ